MPNWGKDPQPWVPLWSMKWLHGSTREELTMEERSVWVDFLALAAIEQGVITKRTYTQLARELNLNKDFNLTDCINKFISTGKILDYPDKWVIKNWEEYQLTNWIKKGKRKSEKPNKTDVPNSLFGQSFESRIEETRIYPKLDENPSSFGGQISEFVSYFNLICTNLVKVERITERRREKIILRLKFQPNLQWWKRVFEIANEIDLPANEKYPSGWRPNFDWLIHSDENPNKVSEGRYKQTRKLSAGEKWEIAKEEQWRREEAKNEKGRGALVPAGDGKAKNSTPDQH